MAIANNIGKDVKRIMKTEKTDDAVSYVRAITAEERDLPLTLWNLSSDWFVSVTF